MGYERVFLCTSYVCHLCCCWFSLKTFSMLDMGCLNSVFPCNPYICIPFTHVHPTRTHTALSNSNSWWRNNSKPSTMIGLLTFIYWMRVKHLPCREHGSGPCSCGVLLFSCSVVSNSFVTPWSVARQAPLSMGFLRQEYLSGTISSFRGSSQTRDQTWVSCISRLIFHHWATRKTLIGVVHIFQNSLWSAEIWLPLGKWDMRL